MYAKRFSSASGDLGTGARGHPNLGHPDRPLFFSAGQTGLIATLPAPREQVLSAQARDESKAAPDIPPTASGVLHSPAGVANLCSGSAVRGHRDRPGHLLRYAPRRGIPGRAFLNAWAHFIYHSIALGEPRMLATLAWYSRQPCASISTLRSSVPRSAERKALCWDI